MNPRHLPLIALLALTACQSTAPDDSPRGREATDDFALGANRRPSATTLHSMARILASQGRDAECEVVLQRLITDYPKFGPAYNELAEVYLRNRELDSALATLELGLEELPEDPVLLNNKGMCLILDGDYEGALDWFQAAAESRPSSARMRANLALALGMLGRDDESKALYQQVLGPRFAEHNLAVVRAARKESDPAERRAALGHLEAPALSGEGDAHFAIESAELPRPTSTLAEPTPKVIEPSPVPEPVEIEPQAEAEETPRPAPGRAFVPEQWRGVAREDLTATSALVVEKTGGVEVRVYSDGRRQISLATDVEDPVWVFAPGADHRLSPGASAVFDPAGELSRSYGQVEPFEAPGDRPAWSALAPSLP